MLLRYRGVPYEATPAAVSQALVPESFLTYRGARYKPNLNPSPPIESAVCYRGVPYKLNGETVPAIEKYQNPLISVILLKETHHFSVGSH